MKTKLYIIWDIERKGIALAFYNKRLAVNQAKEFNKARTEAQPNKTWPRFAVGKVEWMEVK